MRRIKPVTTVTDLIITNGDHAADLLAAAGKPGLIMPWRDILHEGPIVIGPLVECSRVRAAFLAERFRIPLADIEAGFAERDAVMARLADHPRIELWFEHDLYDQLQLVQVLACLAADGRTDGVTLVQADDFLGRQRPDTILAFEALARRLERADLDLGADVWSGLAAPTPAPAERWSRTGSARLPFLAATLHRFLEELPAPGTGLGRTEATALEGIAHGIADPAELFHSTIAEEEAAFMGDLSFFRLLEDLAFCDVPLIDGLPTPEPSASDFAHISGSNLALTMAGEAVLAGDEDHVDLNGIERWWAGTHLRPGHVWRYDRAEKRLVSPGGAGA
jgi:hypothetical protein